MKAQIMMLSLALALPAAGAWAETFEQVFDQQRALYGKGREFSFEGKTYTTLHPEEVEAMVEPTRGNAERLIASAEALRRHSAELGYEWRDPGRYIRQAESALVDGEYQKAMDLAARAKYQVRMSIAQYEHVQAHWQDAVPD